MFSIFKKKEPVIRVPQWSRVANATEYTAFKKAVLHYFENDDVYLDFNAGIAKLGNTKPSAGHLISLIELFKLCLSRGGSDSFSITIEEFMTKKIGADRVGIAFNPVKGAEDQMLKGSYLRNDCR